MTRRRRDQKRVLTVALGAGTALAAAWVAAQVGDPPPPQPVERSSFVYPEHAPSIRFPHDKHQGVTCSECHTAASTSQRSRDDLGPAMTACVGCHAESAKPALQECAACHVGYSQRAEEPVRDPEQWRAVRPAPMRVPPAPANLRFNHAVHAPKVSCTTCHAADAQGKPTFPTERDCVSCHHGSDVAVTCTSCHPTDAATGKIATRTDGVNALLRPDNHTVDWMRRHATVSKTDSADCMSCHTEQDCATCHVGAVATPFSVHPPNFLTVHAVDARMNAGNCSDCHSVQTFCTTCHTRAEATTHAGHEPPARRNFHPPGWLDSTTANNHGVLARRDIVECATCHSETDCITCHTAINPHPPEFVMNCSRLLAQNSVSCTKCHDDQAALRLLCR